MHHRIGVRICLRIHYKVLSQYWDCSLDGAAAAATDAGHWSDGSDGVVREAAVHHAVQRCRVPVVYALRPDHNDHRGCKSSSLLAFVRGFFVCLLPSSSPAAAAAGRRSGQLVPRCDERRAFVPAWLRLLPPTLLV